MRSYINVAYGQKHSNKLDVFVNQRQETVVYIHGGSLSSGDKTAAKEMREKLPDNGYSVISINSSLYPEAKFPEFIDDCAIALKFIKDNIKTYGYGEKICVVGGSAGAYIALMLFFDERYLAKYGSSSADFYSFVIDSAQPTAHFNVLKERGLETYAIRVDETAPIYFLKKKDYGSKLSIITYEEDMYCRKEQNQMFDKTLDSYNIPHDFYLLKGTHCSAELSDEKGEIRIIPIIEKALT